MKYKGSNPFMKEMDLIEWLAVKQEKITSIISRHVTPDTELDRITASTRKVLKQIRKETIGDDLARFYDTSKNGTENYRIAENRFYDMITIGQERGVFPDERRALMSSTSFVGLTTDLERNWEANAARKNA